MNGRDLVEYADCMKIAVIADVHGNSLALDAVLHDIAHEDPDKSGVFGFRTVRPGPQCGSSNVALCRNGGR